MTKENDNQPTEQKNRQEVRAQKEAKKKRKKRKPIRLIPIWVRLIIVLLIFAASLVLGAMFGYGIVGDGEPKDVLGKGPWLKIHEIIYKDGK
ncbi:DNA-directed RNA polymerase subunit beta [Anaerobacillus sp. CMMVII]|uniref:DNA-directed RNA polymerase subunit beta n=1 Tax=Anaerobacillus sp. CMMVII TaxID=2755588 RepID=UPI0021B7C92C|nr:DNA-directed RNA polymerase subunit beta [Anaerobacillus sp. CMMVII]MCT8140137.1 DNA-directed RNA polymerase subunit beta [Anaerobacillus sp. CMMVII]